MLFNLPSTVLGSDSVLQGSASSLSCKLFSCSENFGASKPCLWLAGLTTITRSLNNVLRQKQGSTESVRHVLDKSTIYSVKATLVRRFVPPPHLQEQSDQPALNKPRLPAPKNIQGVKRHQWFCPLGIEDSAELSHSPITPSAVDEVAFAHPGTQRLRLLMIYVFNMLAGW